MSDQLAALAAQYGGAPVGSPAPPIPTSTVPVDAPPPSEARPSVSARVGVPAAGRGSQINPDQSMHGLELATTPLAHPTGIDAIDGLLSPAGLASLVAGGYGIARAGIAGGMAAGAKEAMATAAPAVKYEAAKTILEKMGVPSPLAVTVAIAVSGYKKGAKPAATGAASTVPPAGVETAQAALARKVATPPAAVPPTIGEAAEAAPAAAPAAAPVAAPAPSNSLPDQKALNEAALARRRAAYQASQQAAPAADAPAWTPTRIRLTAEESKVAARLLQNGKTDAEVEQAILAARELVKRFGSPTPTRAQTQFPKAMRGGGR